MSRRWNSLGRQPQPPSRLLVQRKCGCGTHAPGGGQCSACARNKVQRNADQTGAEAPSNAVEIPNGSSRSIDPAVRSEMESGFGRNFSDVRIHDNSASHAAAEAMNARAFTVGQSIHFGAGEYAPQTPGGKRLLAHELTHTIQQQGVGGDIQRFAAEGMVADVGHLEAEADRAADQVVAGRLAQVSGSAGTLAPQLDEKGKDAAAAAPAKVVEPVEPDPKQKGVIEDARRAAAIRTQVAMFKASGIQGASQFEEARKLAKIKFDWENPNMEQIGGILSGMGGGLVTVDVKVAGKGDSECGSRSGYVRGHRPPIVLCPAFFTDPLGPEGQIRTMIHEMAHVKGIGNADVGEQYFMTFDCDQKGSFDAADSWANYVHCMSGQTPDKPEAIQGKPGGSTPGGAAPGAAPGGKK
ncbi:MAG: DUF4157 domain-containing protein [Sphingomonas sp.]